VQNLRLHVLAPLPSCGHKGGGVPEAPPVERNGGGNPLALYVEKPPKGLVLVGLFHGIR